MRSLCLPHVSNLKPSNPYVLCFAAITFLLDSAIFMTPHIRVVVKIASLQSIQHFYAIVKPRKETIELLLIQANSPKMKFLKTPKQSLLLCCCFSESRPFRLFRVSTLGLMSAHLKNSIHFIKTISHTCSAL